MRLGCWRVLIGAGLLFGPGDVLGQQGFNVTLLHTPPAQIVEGRDLTISGNIINADQVSIAALAFRIQGQTEYEIRELRLVSGDIYEGIIPGKSIKPPAVEYYCYAVDFEGNRHVVFASEEQPQRVNVLNPKAAADAAKGTGSKPPDKAKKADKGTPGTGKDALTAAALERVPEESVGVATRSEQKIGLAPAMVSVMSRDLIVKAGCQTVADIVAHLPGIHIARAVSGEYRLTLRGVQSDPEVLVLLDGHRINDPFNGAALLEFPADAVERVELLRGPGSALYGSNALSGVIHITSRKGAEFGASAGYGLFNTARVSASGGYSSERFSITGQAQFLYTQGQDRTVESDVFTGVEGEDDPDELDVSNTPGSVDDGRLQVHGQLNGKLGLGKGGELALLSHYLFQERGAYVGKFNSLDRGSALSVNLATLDLRHRVALGPSVELDSGFTFDTQMVDRGFQVIPASADNAYIAGTKHLKDGLRETTAYRTQTLGAEVAGRFRLMENNTLLGALQFEYLSIPTFTLNRDAMEVSCVEDPAGNPYLLIQGFALPCGKGNGLAAGKQRLQFSALVQDYWTAVVKGLDLLAGFRLDYFDDVGLAFAPRAAVVYRPFEDLRAKVLYSMAFRVPTFQELYEDRDFDPLRSFSGNDQLNAVTVNTVEVGVEGRIETRPMEFWIRGNFFASFIRERIEPFDTGQGYPFYDNSEQRDLLGTEIEAVAQFGPRNRISLNSSWFRAEVLTEDQPDSSYITDVPQMLLNLDIHLAVSEWLNLHLDAQFGSERRNNVRQNMEMLRAFRIPAYLVVGAGLTTEPVLFDHLAFFAHFTNVFDVDHRDPPPWPEHLPGMLPREPFAFFAGLSWRP